MNDASANTIIVDCDGVIADKKLGNDYSNAKPLKHGIAQVNSLYEMGYIITLYTARYGDREFGNIHMQYERGYVEWLRWLQDNGVLYHHAFMGKPAGILYIDDKAARVSADSESGWKLVWEEVQELIRRDKFGNLK